MTEQKEWFGGWRIGTQYSEYVKLRSIVICAEVFDILQWPRSALGELVDGVKKEGKERRG